MERRKQYPSDVSDGEWRQLEGLLPKAKPGGRPRKYPLREIVNALFYLARTGSQWRYLPEGFPPWQTVYTYFRNWERDGTWERVNLTLVQQLRLRSGRDGQPSAGIIDSQSVKTTRKGGRTATMAARKSTDESGMWS